MEEQFLRTAMLLGESGIEKLKHSKVAVFGLGGVGGHVVEALVRSGIGAIDLIDNDTVNPSNLNRQIIATYDTLGKYKTDAMAERIAKINPECKVTKHNLFYLPNQANQIPFSEYDFLVDAIDTVTAKLDLAFKAQSFGIPIISSMGTGNKLEPQYLEITDIYNTSVCPLAKVMRRECRARGIEKLTVVYSKEPPRTLFDLTMQEGSQGAVESAGNAPENRRRSTPGSTAFVPAVAGLMMAGYVVRCLTEG